MEIKEFESKIKKYITDFRRTEAERGEIADSKFYLKPCQITVVWFQNEDQSRDLQVFIFTHWDEEEDLEVEIHGPVKFSEFMKFSKSFIKQEKWSRSINIENYPDPSIFHLHKPFFDAEYQYSKIVELILFKAYDLLKAKIFQEANDYRYHNWILYSKFQDKDIDAEIEKLFKEQKVKAEVSEDRGIFKGVYTYFYPNLWIGPPPAISFEDRINDVPLSKFLKGYKTSFKERDLILKSNGYIALETKDGEIPTEEVNLIMALVFLSGKDITSITRWDLMSITFEKSTGRPLLVKFSEITERSRLHHESTSRISEF